MLYLAHHHYFSSYTLSYLNLIYYIRIVNRLFQLCLPDDPQEVRDAARDIDMKDIGLLGYVAAGQDADMQAPKLPACDEKSADYLYPHEQAYLAKEAVRRKKHGQQCALNRVDALLQPGMAVLPQRLPLIEKRNRGTYCQ